MICIFNLCCLVYFAAFKLIAWKRAARLDLDVTRKDDLEKFCVEIGGRARIFRLFRFVTFVSTVSAVLIRRYRLSHVKLRFKCQPNHFNLNFKFLSLMTERNTYFRSARVVCLSEVWERKLRLFLLKLIIIQYFIRIISWNFNLIAISLY